MERWQGWLALGLGGLVAAVVVADRGSSLGQTRRAPLSSAPQRAVQHVASRPQQPPPSRLTSAVSPPTALRFGASSGIAAQEWRDQLSSDIGDTVTDLYDECLGLHGIDSSQEGRSELRLTVVGDPELGTLVTEVSLVESSFGEELDECLRHSSYALAAESPREPLREEWELAIQQSEGRRVFMWGGVIEIDEES